MYSFFFGKQVRHIYNVSKLVNMFSDHLESCQTLRKVSRLSKHFPDDPKTSKPSGKFPDHSESFQTIRKVSRSSGKFPDHPESFQTIKKYVYFGMFFNDGFHRNVQNLSGW